MANIEADLSHASIAIEKIMSAGAENITPEQMIKFLQTINKAALFVMQASAKMSVDEKSKIGLPSGLFGKSEKKPMTKKKLKKPEGIGSRRISVKNETGF